MYLYITESIPIRSRRLPAAPASSRGRFSPSLGTFFSQPTTSAPSGTSPVSRYFHNATNSFRANATIPTFRARAFPAPNRAEYHSAQRALRLVPQPAPRQLDHHPPHPPIARLADPLLAPALAAGIRRRRQARQAPQLAAVPDLTPAEELLAPTATPRSPRSP